MLALTVGNYCLAGQYSISYFESNKFSEIQELTILLPPGTLQGKDMNLQCGKVEWRPGKAG